MHYLQWRATTHCSVQCRSQSQTGVKWSGRIPDKVTGRALNADLSSSAHCLHIIVFHFLVWFIRVASNSLVSLCSRTSTIWEGSSLKRIVRSRFAIWMGWDSHFHSGCSETALCVRLPTPSIRRFCKSWSFDLQEKWNTNSPWWPSFKDETSLCFRGV